MLIIMLPDGVLITIGGTQHTNMLLRSLMSSTPMMMINKLIIKSLHSLFLILTILLLKKKIVQELTIHNVFSGFGQNLDILTKITMNLDNILLNLDGMLL